MEKHPCCSYSHSSLDVFDFPKLMSVYYLMDNKPGKYMLDITKELFRVDVLFNGRKHYVLRRNSEFQTLHRKLRKIIQTPDFPSKRNQHLRTKPLEQRRQELEDYIQDVIYQNEDVPQVLLDFLHLKHFHTGNKISSMELLAFALCFLSYQLSSRRVLGFFQDPYISDCLPDVVVDGVLQGFYPREVRSPEVLPKSPMYWIVDLN
uniref:PX domain-containing protein n=1 Tax=Sphaeramia orbicularis TaxID=375764 RepID=A0A673ABN9_9TELE